VSLQITDPDVRAFAAISGLLSVEYQQGDDPWTGSPFAWIKSQQSRRRGKVGEQLVAGFFAARGFDVSRPRDSQADLVLGGLRAEVKFSTLWESGIYKFQQIRDQRYDVAVCLGICPYDAHCWVIEKPLLAQHVIGRLGQHGGSGRKDTAWMSFRPEEPYQWMNRRGGRLGDAIESLKAILRDNSSL